MLPAPAVVVSCPAPFVPNTACMDQAAIDAAFAQWLGQASVNGGCSPTLSNDAGMAPRACEGGTVTVEFIGRDGCSADTCTSTFTIPAAPAIVLTCPADEEIAACTSQADIDAAFALWLTEVSSTGGCNVIITDNSGSAPDSCGGSVTVQFIATGDCKADTCTSVFTVLAPDDIVLTCPVDEVIASCTSQSEIDAAFALWLAEVSSTGGCNVIITDNSGNAPDSCGGSVTVEFTATGDCDSKTCSADLYGTTCASSSSKLSCSICSKHSLYGSGCDRRGICAVVRPSEC